MHTHKRQKKLIREKLKITACHWWQANFCCLITSSCWEMAQHQQYKLQSWERSFSCPLALLQRQLTSLWLWKQHRKKKSWGHKPQQIAVQQLQAEEQIGTGNMWKHEKITLICPELICQSWAKTTLFLGSALCFLDLNAVSRLANI